LRAIATYLGAQMTPSFYSWVMLVFALVIVFA
jgi:hypothetical protein